MRFYNKKIGLVEQGDTQEFITQAVNSAFGIQTDWNRIARVSFIKDVAANPEPGTRLSVGILFSQQPTLKAW